MMNDDESNDDHPLANSGMYSIDDYEDEDESDLFGRIPNNDAKESLFADVDQALQESEDVEKEDKEDKDDKVPDASFYRPDNLDGGSLYSTIYDKMPSIPPPPPTPPPPPPPNNVATNTSYTSTSTPSDNEVKFMEVIIHEPRLVHTSSLVFSGPSYWTYAITSTTDDNKKVMVRRRFRHFVALEDRIRKTSPGLILPPRPEKHPPLSDEALHQTMSFAKARAIELQSYIRSLLSHPLIPCISYPSSPLYTFLTFPQDDLGIMWSEVSSATLKRLSVAASRLTETVSTTAQSSLNLSNVTETDVEIRNLVSCEQNRLNIIQGSIPKLLGYLTLLQEYGLFCGGTGMELSKLSKDVKALDPQLSPNVELLSLALLLSSRRFKKQHHDITNTLHPFDTELNYIPSYQSAFNDRKHACMIVDSTRSKFLDKNNRILELQSSMNPSEMHRLAQLEQEMKMIDVCSANAVKKAEEIGVLLTQEVKRLEMERRREWRMSLLDLAKEMKQVCGDQANIWENAKKKISES